MLKKDYNSAIKIYKKQMGDDSYERLVAESNETRNKHIFLLKKKLGCTEVLADIILSYGKVSGLIVKSFVGVVLFTKKGFYNLDSSSKTTLFINYNDITRIVKNAKSNETFVIEHSGKKSTIYTRRASETATLLECIMEVLNPTVQEKEDAKLVETKPAPKTKPTKETKDVKAKQEVKKEANPEKKKEVKPEKKQETRVEKAPEAEPVTDTKIDSVVDAKDETEEMSEEEYVARMNKIFALYSTGETEITRKVMDVVFEDYVDKEGNEGLDKLKNTQKDIRTLVDAETQKLSKIPGFKKVLFYYGSKTADQKELQDAAIYTNNFVSFYEKDTGASTLVFYNKVDVMGIRDGLLEIRTYNQTTYKLSLTYLKETYEVLDRILKVNRSQRNEAGEFDCMEVSDEYKEPLNKLRKALTSGTFDLLAKDHNYIQSKRSVYKEALGIDVLDCGLAYFFKSKIGEIGIIAFDKKNRMVYWTHVRNGCESVLYKVAFDTIKNVWADLDTICVQLVNDRVYKIMTFENEQKVLESLKVFIPHSELWHKAYEVDGVVARVIDAQRIKNSINEKTYEEAYKVISECAKNAGMDDYTLIMNSISLVDRRILAGYAWDKYLRSKLDEHMFWICMAAALPDMNPRYNPKFCYESYRRTHEAPSNRRSMSAMTYPRVMDALGADLKGAFEIRKAQFLYSDGDIYNFMDNETFEMYSVESFYIGSLLPELVESNEYNLYCIENEVLFVRKRVLRGPK